MEKSNYKQRKKTITITPREETLNRLESFVGKYYKQNPTQVVWEIVEQFIDDYESAEEKRIEAMGKSQAPSKTETRRARKVA